MDFLKNARFFENITLDGSLYFVDTSTYIKRNNDKELVFEDPSAGLRTLSSLIGGGSSSPTFGTEKAWVNAVDGDDGTGEVGNILKPFATVQSAIDAIGTSVKDIWITSDITEDFQTASGDLNLHLVGEVTLDACIYLTNPNGSGIYSDGNGFFTGSVGGTSPGTWLFNFEGLNEIHARPGEYIFGGGVGSPRNLEIRNVRYIESDYYAGLFRSSSNVVLYNIGTIVNTNDSSSAAYIFNGGNYYLRDIGLIQLDNSSGFINESSGFQGERFNEVQNVTFKGAGRLFRFGYAGNRFRGCRFISGHESLAPFLLDNYFSSYGTLQLYDCQIDTSAGVAVQSTDANTELYVNGLMRNCVDLTTGTFLNTAVANDVYWSNFTIGNPWFTDPFDA